MDRNSAIGLTLITLLLLVYFYYFGSSPKAEPQQEAPKKEILGEKIAPKSAVSADTADVFFKATAGTATDVVAETSELKITFSTLGGTIKTAELKNYKTYSGQKLELITPENNEFSLVATRNGKPVDLYGLYYTSEVITIQDTTIVTFKSVLADSSTIIQEYKLPATGFLVGYKIRSTAITDESLTFDWKNLIRLKEKSIADSRTNSGVGYYGDTEGFDRLSETSTDLEQEDLTAPVKWVSVKDKFFLASIIGGDEFKTGKVETSGNESDSTLVKRANIQLEIDSKSIATKGVSFYLGPNDYKKIGSIAPGFSRNVNIGWKPIYWINKFIIFPVFHYLTTIMNNYGVIIIILVVLLKLVLLPLSYKSYLSMSKMRILKPELDEIKERVGEDQVKVQQEQMKLYSQVGVSPFSGCIPVLLQLPILLAMFSLFPASIELRQQPFLWAEDLSTFDSPIMLPFLIPFMGSHISLFTILMTASTLIYTWQNNQLSSVTGPMKSMSYLMPFIFFFALNSFSAGLTFYYLVSNLVTFAQQAIIRRFVDEDKIKAIMEENRKKNAAGKAGKSSFMNRLQDAMKASEEARRKAEEDRKKGPKGRK